MKSLNTQGQGQRGLEYNIIRMLALVSLTVAAVIAGYITINSGVFGSTGGEENANVSTVQTQPVVEEPAAEEVVAPGTTTPTQNTYEIKPNDSFATIAEQYNTSIARIVELNPNLDPQNLKPGTVINVP